ncbi:MAG: potassium channel protein [bacterium]
MKKHPVNTLYRELMDHLRLPLILLFCTVVFGVGGYMLIGASEGRDWTILQCLFMTVISLTTVGYGDILGVESSAVASLFTMGLIILGMGVVLYGVSKITAFFVEGGVKEVFKEHKMLKKISLLKDHVIIAGIGGTGEHVVEEVQRSGMPYVIIDSQMDHINDMMERYGEVNYILGDATDDEVLIDAGIESAMGIVACLSNDKDNLYLTVTAKNLNPKIKVVARGIAVQMREKLTRVGANYVVSPNQIGGLRMASEMLRPNVVSFLDRMLRSKEMSVRVGEVTVRPGSPIAGKTIGETAVYEKTGLLIIALLDAEKGEFEYNPAGSDRLDEGDVMIVIGAVDSIEKLKILAGH